VSQNQEIEEILTAIEMLRDRAQIDVQYHWHSHFGDGDHPSGANWPLAEPNEKGYLVWERGEKVRWLWQAFTVPEYLNGYPVTGLQLRLCLTWWAGDAQVFCNGELLQAGDLFDSSARVLLSPQVEAGQAFEVMIRLVSPGHDIGALMRSHLRYEASIGALDPAFVADELTVLTQYCQHFQPEALPTIAAALAKIGDHSIDLTELRTPLLPLGEALKTRQFHILGHAHLDLAWLWDVPETYDVAERTFQSVLNLQTKFPELTFCHTSPALYEWIEQHRPALFAEIQAAVTAGTWEPLGGMWVEPDVILPGGEAIARQLLYGQRYTQAKFGKITEVAWLTDSFGFPWQLPQLLTQAGIRYFVTQKLHWNDTTKFPHGFFRWQAPDGTELLTLISPPNVTGVMDTNPITMTNYSVDWEAQTGFKDIFWLPGVGDHGGGPSRDMLAVQRRWQTSPFFPKIQFTTATAYLDHLANQGAVNPHPPAPAPKGEEGESEGQQDRNTAVLPASKGGDQGQNLPLWADELYLELHRGCYTVHADQKWFNRCCEAMLYEAELWSTIATILTAAPYPQKELEQAWKQVLFNQFHDILPGTSIPPVFERANRDWQAALTTGERLRNQALIAISARIQCPPRPALIPFVIFNALNHQRIDAIKFANMGQIYDSTGGELPSQGIEGGSMAMVALPSVGYTLIWADPQPLPLLPLPSEPVLENEYLRVEIDPQTGDLAQVWHQNRPVLAGPGNQLQAFRDQGQYWDAWNIAPDYQQHPLAEFSLSNWQWLEWGPVRSRLRVIRRFQASTFTQDYILEAGSGVLKIATEVDWRETQVMVKANFPLTLKAEEVIAEMACGAIARPTRPQTAAEQAKWEIPAHRWADLSDGAWGVSLLNDCKYGYDAGPNHLRLTLLRSPVWPDPGSDRCNDTDPYRHHCTYALYPHPGTWQEARTVQLGYNLNHLPICLPFTASSDPVLPPMGSLLTLGADHLVLMALKPSEADPQTLILRAYEAHGETATLTLGGLIPLGTPERRNILETPMEGNVTLTPWQIATFALSLPELIAFNAP